MYIDVPKTWDKVSEEAFDEALDDIEYRRCSYANAIEYRVQGLNGEVFGYVTDKGDHYLKPRALGA